MKLKKRLKLSAMTVFFAMLLGIALMSIGTEQAFAMEGVGTPENPYEISTYAELKEFAVIVNGTNGATQNTSACAILTADIDASSSGDWVPIGNQDNPYTGTFDGQGHTIRKLSNGECTNDNQGLFGRIGSGGTVQNVGLEDISIKGGECVGGVAGANNKGTIESCYNTGTVSGSTYMVGGVVGDNFKGEITNCYNTGDVSGDTDVGGVAGTNVEGTIENCYNTGAVSGYGQCFFGGVAGHNAGTIKNCYNTGEVSGGDKVGGVAGTTWGGTIENCYYDMELCTAYSAVADAADTDNVKGLKTADMTGTDCTSYDSWDDFYSIWKLTDGYPVLDPHDHELIYEDEQTCVEPGHVEGYTCSVCNKHFSDEDGKVLIPDADWPKTVTGHNWSPDWSTDGDNHWHECTVCHTKKDEAAHTWDAGKVTKAATEQAEGVKTYTCTVCKATKTETVPKLTPSTPKTSGTPTAKMTAGKTSMTIGWNKIQGVDGYDIFFAECNHSGKKIVCKNVKTIKGNKTFTWTKSGLKKGTAYKAYVKAYVMNNGKKKYVKTSPMMHAYTGNGTKKYTNAKSVTVNKTKVSLKKGKTYKIKASVKKMKKNKKLMPKSHVATLRYLTSNSKVATVSKSGKITAKGKGSCVIYVFAHNGVSKQVKVTVK